MRVVLISGARQVGRFLCYVGSRCLRPQASGVAGLSDVRPKSSSSSVRPMPPTSVSVNFKGVFVVSSLEMFPEPGPWPLGGNDGFIHRHL